MTPTSTETLELPSRTAWGFVIAFLAAITIPGVWREFSGDSLGPAALHVVIGGEGTVATRLRALEKQVDDGAWTRPLRQAVQARLVTWFHEGNRKVAIGSDGWLFHRPGIRALTGRGPMLGPNHSVSKDPALADWEGPLPVIEDFAAQLRERGIRLVLVPVPDKAALQWRHVQTPRTAVQLANVKRTLVRSGGFVDSVLGTHLGTHFGWAFATYSGWVPPIRHPDQAAFLQHLAAAGVTVPDGESEAFRTDFHSRTDTHPTSPFFVVEAAALRSSLRSFLPNSDDALTPAGLTWPAATDHGDLVHSLDAPAAAIPPEALVVGAVSPFVSDPTSPLVLLGDSNVNMYDDPSLPFHVAGAGFGSWLAATLGRPLHVIAINGGGATKVRQEFARLPDDVVRAKKVVIWVIAERDLFMDPAVARENGVEWKRVVFNAAQSQPAGASPDEVELEATLLSKPPLTDLRQANYPDCVYTAEMKVDRVVRGDFTESTVNVVLWNFRGRSLQPSARHQPGEKLRLVLKPWSAMGPLTSTNNDTGDELSFDARLWWAEKISPL